MAYVTLAQAKAHLNIDNAFTADDNLITMYIDVAVTAVERHLNAGSIAERWGEGEQPSPVTAAILLLVGTLYKDREATTEKALQMPIYDYLLSQYRHYTVC